MRAGLTVEESQERVDRLKQAIEAAKSRREYTRADVLQACLRKEERAHQRLLARQEQTDVQEKIAECESEREAEQNSIISSVDERLAQIKQYYTLRYKELQVAHHDNIERIQEKFSSATWSVTRLSPTLRSLERAEKFYADQGDFKAAEQIKRQIQVQTRKELREREANTQAAIDADVAAAVTVYQGQQRSFAQRLLNDKNVLKRDVEREILAIQNKYRKKYHNLTKKSEHEFDLTSRFQQRLFMKIDKSIQAFAAQIQAAYQVPGTLMEGDTDEVEREAAITAPRNRPIPGRAKDASTPRRSASVRTSTRRSASVRNQKRNPRVAVALSRTNRNIDLATTVNVS